MHWNPEKVKQAIDMEMHVNGKKPEEVATKKLREALPAAVEALVQVALYSDNETLRCKAAQYIIDRNMGRVTDVPMGYKGSDPLTNLVEEIVSGGNEN